MVKLTLYQSIFCEPTHLTSCYTETALLASYISFHNKERSAVVEIFFFLHCGCAAKGKGRDLRGLELFVKGGIIDLDNVKSMKKRLLNLSIIM